MKLVGPSVMIALGKPQRVIQEIIALAAGTASVDMVGITSHIEEKVHFSRSIYFAPDSDSPIWQWSSVSTSPGASLTICSPYINGRHFSLRVFKHCKQRPTNADTVSDRLGQ